MTLLDILVVGLILLIVILPPSKDPAIKFKERVETDRNKRELSDD